MLIMWAAGMVFSLRFTGASAQGQKNNTHTGNEMSDFLTKFHQSDYNLAFEWAELVDYNKDCFKSFVFRPFKYNRTYTTCNATFTLNTNLGNELEFILQVYKFASNEYRLFPIRFQINFCQAIDMNVMGFARFLKCGNLTCPLLKGRTYQYCNWAPDMSRYPPYIPTGKYMAKVEAMHQTKIAFVQKFYGSVVRSIVKK